MVPGGPRNARDASPNHRVGRGWMRSAERIGNAARFSTPPQKRLLPAEWPAVRYELPRELPGLLQVLVGSTRERRKKAAPLVLAFACIELRGDAPAHYVAGKRRLFVQRRR